MFRFNRRRATGLAAAFAAAAGLLAPPPRDTAAAPQADPAAEVLSWVPRDAALFAHVDVQAVWKSKLGDTVRKTNALEQMLAPRQDPAQKAMMEKKGMDMKAMPRPASPVEQIKRLSDATGIRPDDVKTFTVYIPKLKGPGDEQTAVFAFTFAKEYDRGKLLAGLAEAGGEREKAREVSPGVFAFGDPAKEKSDADKAGRRPTPVLRYDLSHPKRVVVLGPKVDGLPKAAAGDGPLAAVVASAGTKAAVGSMNFAQFPEEVRGDGLPPEIEPFKPLLHSDLIVGTIELGDLLSVRIEAKCPDRAKAVEAEKSFGVGRSLLATLVAAGIQETEKQQKDEVRKPVVAEVLPLLKTLQEALRAAKFGTADNTASVSVALKADIDFATPLAKVFGSVGGAASRSVDQNNLKQLALSMHNYESANGKFPTAATLGKKGKPLHSWRVAVLPYVEQNELYAKLKLNEPWDSEHNKKLFEEAPMPEVFRHPSEGKPGDKLTHYQVFTGGAAAFDLVQAYSIASFSDGTSNTLLIATAKKPVKWYEPTDLEFDPKADPRDVLLYLNETTQVAFADGSVRALKKTMSADTLRAIVTRNGGEVISYDD